MLVRETDTPVFYAVVRGYLAGERPELSLRASGATELSEFLVRLVHADMVDAGGRQRALPAPISAGRS